MAIDEFLMGAVPSAGTSSGRARAFANSGGEQHDWYQSDAADAYSKRDRERERK